MNQIIHQVRLISQNDTSGHDWWHIQRVVNLAMYIGRRENADLRLVQLGALLHDLDDWKFNECGADQPIARRVMAENGIEAAIANRVISIISEVSFKGAGVDTTPTSLEAKVVQDADRLDPLAPLGLLGIRLRRIRKTTHAYPRFRTEHSRQFRRIQEQSYLHHQPFLRETFAP
jgi:HD superfamily phosphodiesterase